jgi:16S rRNA (adenine1518-N6/adenine1519-N6)-dimethyltransferase
MSEVRAKKALGQHFLVDLNIARKICDSLGGGTSERPCPVLEVGCGMGVLTQFLLKRTDVVTYGAEIDSESVAYLHAHYPEFTPRLMEGDFLKMDLRTLFPEGLRVIGNFPYNKPGLDSGMRRDDPERGRRASGGVSRLEGVRHLERVVAGMV